MLKKALFCCLGILILAGCRFSDESSENKLTPSDYVDKLLTGNNTFRKTQSKSKILTLKNGQFPFAVVVCCSDSRVAPELIFNQGLGDLFVVRTAGNIIGEYELGSIEYAIDNFRTPVIIVLGHDDCGAVTAYYEHKNDTLPGSIQSIVNYIKEEEELKAISDTTRSCIPHLVKGNVLHALHLLRSDPMFAKRIASNQLNIVGAIYHLHDGTVELIE